MEVFSVEEKNALKACAEGASGVPCTLPWTLAGDGFEVWTEDSQGSVDLVARVNQPADGRYLVAAAPLNLLRLVEQFEAFQFEIVTLRAEISEKDEKINRLESNTSGLELQIEGLNYDLNETRNG